MFGVYHGQRVENKRHGPDAVSCPEDHTLGRELSPYPSDQDAAKKASATFTVRSVHHVVPKIADLTPGIVSICVKVSITKEVEANLECSLGTESL